jgi:hypothetical protein
MRWWVYGLIGVSLIAVGVFGVVTRRRPPGHPQAGQPWPDGLAVGGLLVCIGIPVLAWGLVLGIAPELILSWPGVVLGFGQLLLLSLGLSWHSLKKQPAG